MIMRGLTAWHDKVPANPQGVVNGVIPGGRCATFPSSSTT